MIPSSLLEVEIEERRPRARGELGLYLAHECKNDDEMAIRRASKDRSHASDHEGAEKWSEQNGFARSKNISILMHLLDAAKCSRKR